MKGWSWIAWFAAYEGQFEIIQWLFTTRPNDMTDGVFKSAIAGDNLEIAKWAYPKVFRERNSCETLSPCYFQCVEMPMVKWILHENEWPSQKDRTKWREKISQKAIAFGSLEVVKYACEHQVHERGFDFPELVETAAIYGRLDVLMWFIEQGATLSLSSAKVAVRNGNINVIEWLHANRQSSGTDHRANRELCGF